MRVRLAALVVLASGCGRTGFEIPGPLDPVDERVVAIGAPAGVIAHHGCPASIAFAVQDGNGIALGESHDLAVSVSRGSLSPDGMPGPVGRSARVRTNASGLASILYLPDAFADPGESVVFEANVAGYAPVAKAAVPFVDGVAPQLVAGVDLDGDGDADAGPFVSLAAGTSARLVVTITDDDPPDARRVRWASDHPSLDLDADSDGTPGGDRLTGTVPLGPHAVIAEYADCAGRTASTYFRVEGGTRRRVTVSSPTIASDDVEQVEADRTNPLRAFVAFGIDAQGQRVTVSTNGAAVVNLGNTARNIRRLEWAGGTRILATYQGQNGWQEIDGDGPSIVTTTTGAPYDYEIERVATCDDGRGYTTETANFGFVNVYRWPTNGGDNLFLGDALSSPIVARRRPSGSCEIFGGTNGAAGIVLDTNGGLSLLETWEPQDGFFSNPTAIGFAGPSIFWAENDGIWLSEDTRAPPVRLWDELGLPDGSQEVPAGFAFTDVRSITGGTLAGVDHVWIANAAATAGQENVLRLVRLAPRDAFGRASPARWVPLPYLDDGLDDGDGAVDVSVPRLFDGSLVADQPVWVATPQGLTALWWSP